MSLLSALVAAAPSLPAGGKSVPVRWGMDINTETGQVSFTDFGKANVVYIPQVSRGSSIVANTALDTAAYLLGVGMPGRPTAWAKERFDAYLDVLATVPGQEASKLHAWLRGRNRPSILPLGVADMSPEDVEAVRRCAAETKAKTKALMVRGTLTTDAPTLAAYGQLIVNADRGTPCVVAPFDPESAILVGINGDFMWWDRPEIWALHKRRARVQLAAGADVPWGQCAVSLEREPLARLVPQVNGGALVSFNRTSSEAYGQKQAYVAPLGLDAAERLAQGLGYVMRLPGAKHLFSIDGHNGYIWTQKSSDPPVTWEDVFEARAIPDIYLLVVSKLMLRLATRRFYALSGKEVRDRVKRWMSVMLAVSPDETPVRSANLLMTRPIMGGDASKPEEKQFQACREAFILWLLAGEPLPAPMLHNLRANGIGLAPIHARARALHTLHGDAMTPEPHDETFRALGYLAARGCRNEWSRTRGDTLLTFLFARTTMRNVRTFCDLIRKQIMVRTPSGNHVDAKMASEMVQIAANFEQNGHFRMTDHEYFVFMESFVQNRQADIDAAKKRREAKDPPAGDLAPGDP